MDGAHLSARLHCLKASEDLEHVLGLERRDKLSDLLDLSASYGCAGLRSLEALADEDYMGSFAGIAAYLISFGTKTEFPACVKIAEALETPEDPKAGSCCPTVDGVKEANERMTAMREPLSKA